MNSELPVSTNQCWAIVPAAGVGSRMQSSTPKQYLPLAGRALIEHSLLRLLELNWITGIVVAIHENDNHWGKLSLSHNPKIKTVVGGKNRVDSVFNAVELIRHQLQDKDLILVHDAARPCITGEDLQQLYQAMQPSLDPNNNDPCAGVILADKLTDTIKRDDGNSVVVKTVPREGLWRALTPQMFTKAVLVKALQAVNNKASSSSITDEASAVEALGLSPRLIQGRSDNIKVTHKGDIKLASLILTSHATIERAKED